MSKSTAIRHYTLLLTLAAIRYGYNSDRDIAQVCYGSDSSRRGNNLVMRGIRRGWVQRGLGARTTVLTEQGNLILDKCAVHTVREGKRRKPVGVYEPVPIPKEAK